MTRFAPQGDMTADEIVGCVVQAGAVIRLCEHAAWTIQNTTVESIPQIAEDIQFSARLAADLLGPVQDALESHEGLKGGDA